MASVERYDLASRSWKPAARLPKPGIPAVATLENGNIMAVGLTRRDRQTRAVAVYRPHHRDWRVADPIPGQLWRTPPLALHHGRPFAAGGPGRGECRSSAFRYGARAKEWRRVEPLPEPRCSMLMVTLKDETVLAAGGLDFLEGETGHPTRTSLQFLLHN